MIDTVTIYTMDFKVKKDNRLDICTVNYNMSRFDGTKYFFSYLEDDASCYAYEVGATFNGFRFNIYNIGNSSSSYRSSLNISFEIPSIFEGYNLNPINIDQVGTIKEKIESALLGVGIIADLKQFRIKRIDLFKNIVLDHEVEEYDYVMNFVENIRAGVLSKTEDTVYKGNESYSVCFYDKGKQVSNKYGIDFVPFKGKKLARFEIRLENSAICDRQFKKIGLLNNIHAFCTKSGYRKLHKFFYNEIERLFYFDMKVGTIDTYADLLNAEMLVNKGEKPNVVAALLTFSKHCNEGNFEEFIRIITNGNAVRRSQVRKYFLNKIEKYKLYSPENAIRYNEVKTKLLFDPAMKSLRRKYKSKKVKVISSKEEFLTVQPDYFVAREKEKHEYPFVEIASLFYPEVS